MCNTLAAPDKKIHPSQCFSTRNITPYALFPRPVSPIIYLTSNPTHYHYICVPMEQSAFDQIQHIIKSRRSVSWARMNGTLIPDDVVRQLLALADWAPTHGLTEPWRFFVYSGQPMKEFGKAHADLSWDNTPEDKRSRAVYEKVMSATEKASHLIIVAMQRGTNAKNPYVEEIAATSAAIQNMLLGATALGIASFWSTGGMTLNPVLKTYLQLKEEDQVLGMIYLGFTDEPVKQGARTIPLEDKVKWFQ